MNKIFGLISTMLLSSTLIGCGESYDSILGYKIKYNEDQPTIIDDNYRNYYEIYVGSYCDSNDDKIGDLNGVASKLDYIQSLGYTGIWLMPINSSPSYHKYDVANYYEIDSSYGTIDDLKNLIKECHKRNIRLILDLVLNHSSITNEYFIKATKAYSKYLKGITLTTEEDEFKDFYNFYLEPQKNIKTYQVPNENFYYEGNFSSDMPEFNCNSIYVQNEFKKIIKYCVDMGIDGFRLDAVKYYFINSDSKNISFLNDLIKYCRTLNKNIYVIGECWDSYSVISDYYKSELDSFFNFESYGSTGFIVNSLNMEGGWLKTYYRGLESNYLITEKYIPAPFLCNHDTPRIALESSDDNTKFLFGLLSMLNGSAFTYYGDEIGMVGTNKGDNACDQNVRIAMNWNSNTLCKNPVGTTVAKYVFGTVDEQINNEDSILNYYKRANYLRNKYPAISRGIPELVDADSDLKKLVFKKSYDDSTIGFIINYNEKENLEVNIEDYGFSEVINELVIDKSNSYVGRLKNNNINIPPHGIALIK